MKTFGRDPAQTRTISLRMGLDSRQRAKLQHSVSLPAARNVHH